MTLRMRLEDSLKLVHDGHHRCQRVECGSSTTDGVWERSRSTMVSGDDEEAKRDRQTDRGKGREREREEHNKGLEADVLQEMYNLDRAALL